MPEKGSLPVAVLGAGIAGAQAALDLAQLGHRVVLLEQAEQPGGKFAVLQKTFPTNDCSACALTPQTSFFCIRSPHFIKPAEQERITLLTRVEVEGLAGEPGNFRLQVRREGQAEELNVAALILCPGYEEYLPPSLNSRYGYGRYPDVLTGLELELRLADHKYLRRSDGQPVQQVAFIQCAGSRDLINGVGYCSAVCCLYALKEALLLCEAAMAEGLSRPEIKLFYMDMRTYGKAYERYLQKAKEQYGLELVRSRIHSIIQPAGSSKLIIRYALESGEACNEEFDLAVLATGLRPPGDSKDLAVKLGIDLHTSGFCNTPSLLPVSTSRPGVFVAGAFSGPCDVIDAVTQGSAAAAACAAWLKESCVASEGSNTHLVQLPPASLAQNPSPRIGVFICGCEQLDSSLDLKQLEEYAALLPDVAWVQRLSLCTFSAGEEFQRALREKNLSRIVVAACSARALEPMLAAWLAKAGLPANAVKNCQPFGPCRPYLQ